MNAAPAPANRRLIEEWLPVNELSVESLREKPFTAMPAPNYLHVWWARRPLVASRAAVAASLLHAGADHDAFIAMLGTSPEVVGINDRLNTAKAAGVRLKSPYRDHQRAFYHNPTDQEIQWLRDNLATENPAPLVLDITAGGGSIPFEAGRLGFRSHANDLNPVAALILRATCQWPQKYGRTLLDAYDEISRRFQNRVAELIADIYPPEEQPEWMAEWNECYKAEIKNSRIVPAQRYVWGYLWAGTIECPSCGITIPLSPNWRLSSKGDSLRLLPNPDAGKCDFEIVHGGEISPGTIDDAIPSCPSCGASAPKGYIAQEAQAGRYKYQIYAVVLRDQWQGFTKNGRPKANLDSKLSFRLAEPDDDTTADVLKNLAAVQPQWDAAGILPDEHKQPGDDDRPITYGMTPWRNMFSPRQQLAHGYCVQAFRELVDEDKAAGVLDETRRAAWCYIALALDKIIAYNSLLTTWHPGREVLGPVFATHDFGMKWSYAEMAVVIRGLGLEWVLPETRKCLRELIELSERVDGVSGIIPAPQSDGLRSDTASEVTADSADFLITFGNGSVDAIVFDPPYYDNVSYAELSDFYYVWLKRTAGYIHPEWFGAYLTDKGNEAIASPARFRNGGQRRRSGSIKRQAYEDYVARMQRIFAECRRVVKDDGVVTVMFTHKSTDAWDALTMGIIDAGFRVTATWPVKTESDFSLHTRDKAAARSTILLVCRPKTEGTAVDHSWDQVKQEIADRVRERLPALESYGLRPLDLYLASFGPALEVISNSWPIRRARAHSNRAGDAAFIVTPNDALQVARREVFAARRRKISDRWANNPGDPLTEFYILAQDSAGSARMPFDEANMAARCVGLELTDTAAKEIYARRSSGGDIELLTAQQRFARGYISEQAPTGRSIDRVHTAIALAATRDVNNAIEWCRRQGFQDDAAFRGALEALLRIMKTGDPDREPARTLWSEMYGEAPPEPEGVQPELFAAA